MMGKGYEQKQKRRVLQKRVIAIIVVSLLILGIVVAPLMGLFA